MVDIACTCVRAFKCPVVQVEMKHRVIPWLVRALVTLVTVKSISVSHRIACQPSSSVQLCYAFATFISCLKTAYGRLQCMVGPSCDCTHGSSLNLCLTGDVHPKCWVHVRPHRVVTVYHVLSKSTLVLLSIKMLDV
jgi:hypothetical protein